MLFGVLFWGSVVRHSTQKSYAGYSSSSRANKQVASCMCRSELRLPGSWQLHCAERKLIIHELVVTADLVRAPGGHQPALLVRTYRCKISSFGTARKIDLKTMTILGVSTVCEQRERPGSIYGQDHVAPVPCEILHQGIVTRTSILSAPCFHRQFCSPLSVEKEPLSITRYYVCTWHLHCCSLVLNADGRRQAMDDQRKNGK